MNPFTEDYFLRGPQTGLSNYTDYRWMPDATLELAENIQKHLGILEGDRVLDYGCARGYLVRALRQLGIRAYGYDISEWAIDNCDENVKDMVSIDFAKVFGGRYHYITAKDVIEHVPVPQLVPLLRTMNDCCDKAMLFCVPLSTHPGGPYVRAEDNMDPSHVVRWTLEGWMDFMWSCIGSPNLVINGSWHVPGIKPSSCSPRGSCGFITITK